MAGEQSHRDLIAWQEAMNLVEAVYRVTSIFPKEEAFGLIAQMRRAAISIPSNIAEGAARNSSREFFQYLGVATASMAELETQLELAERLKILAKDTDILVRVRRVGRLVNSLRNSFRRGSSSL
ncbi:MAG: four helix bundle protein [Betaproteobacteria bacterium]|nr:four helix bundle protein [Betaproteobacteria bacterium]